MVWHDSLNWSKKWFFLILFVWGLLMLINFVLQFNIWVGLIEGKYPFSENIIANLFMIIYGLIWNLVLPVIATLYSLRKLKKSKLDLHGKSIYKKISYLVASVLLIIFILVVLILLVDSLGRLFYN